MNKIIQLYIAVIAVLISCSSQNQATDINVLEGSTMGTFYTIKIVTTDLRQQNIKPDSLKLQIDSLLVQINHWMSTYQNDSEITGFNNFSKSEWYPVAPELAYVVSYAQKISKLSDGAFDITVGPLVNLWGFGPEDRTTLVPTDAEIKILQELIGFQKLHVNSTPSTLKKEITEIYCDLSGIAKGYGVDRIAEYLDSLGIRNFMTDIGGEIRAHGRNAGNELWKIGVATPDEEFGVQKVIPLENKAVATSGDYRNYFEKDGQRYSHTIDPRSGKPITHRLASVTVIHDSCMVADGLATAINVMGPEVGYKFAIDRELPVLLIVREDEGFKEKITPQFQKILEFNKNGI
jgi:thiamine biosynthesis lipoprotein